MFVPGQNVKVRGTWRGHPCFYDGHLTAVQESVEVEDVGPTYLIEYDNGVPEEDVDEGTMVPTRAEVVQLLAEAELSKMADYPIGQRVLATWHEVADDGAHSPWFAGVVSQYNAPSPTYTVKYDDGSSEANIAATYLLAAPSHRAATQAYKPGYRVLANFQGSGVWHDASVVEAQDRTVSVRYDDGLTEHVDSGGCILVSEGYAEGRSIFAQLKFTTDEFEWVPGVVVRINLPSCGVVAKF